jgi:putative FmdB family regulatory protein
MPIYEYVCLDCKKEYEILRSFNESDQPMDCEECGSRNVKRKLSLAFAHSGGSSVSDIGGGGGGGCSSCDGGNCGTCGV